MTLDTSVFPAEDLQALATPLQIELHATTVTEREVAETSFAFGVMALPSARETFVFGESALGVGALCNSSDAEILAEAYREQLAGRKVEGDGGTHRYVFHEQRRHEFYFLPQIENVATGDE